MTNYSIEDETVWGTDLVDAARRWAAPVVDQRVGELRGELNQLKTDTARGRVMAALDADPELGGKWRAINEDAAFIAWLGQVDPINGERRMVLLRRAFDTGASDRVVYIFRSYLRETTLPQRQRTGARGPFESDTPTPSIRAGERRMYRRADIARFYRDVRDGRYQGRDPERPRIEADIIAAPREGRILDPAPTCSK